MPATVTPVPSAADLLALMLLPDRQVLPGVPARRVQNPAVLSALAGLATHPDLPPDDRAAAVGIAVVAGDFELVLVEALARLSDAGRVLIRQEVAAVYAEQERRMTGPALAHRLIDPLDEPEAGTLARVHRQALETAAAAVAAGMVTIPEAVDGYLTGPAKRVVALHHGRLRLARRRAAARKAR